MSMHILKQVAPVRPILDQPLLRPVASAADLVEAWLAYVEIKSKLLVPDDYLEIRGKRLVKKSGWAKIQTAFGISDEVINEERKEYKDYFVYHVTVKAIAGNGRFATGLGSCGSNERSFLHPDHDARATAQTRARNRAVSSLVGGGELSAEEIQENPFPVAQWNAPVYSDETSHPQESITQNQRTLLLRLIDHRIEDPEEREEKSREIDELSKQDASELISDLLGQPIIR